MRRAQRESWIRSAITSHAGALPPREFKARVARLGATARLRAAEELEVWRARRQLRNRPHARIVTVIPSIGRDRLVASVRTALEQTIRNHHVVVVSDGSPLPPLPDDPRLTVIALRRRYGVAAVPRNVGIRSSASEFVAFLDDDNTWTPDHLERMVPSLARGADLVYGAVQWVDVGGAPIGTLSVAFDRDRLREENYVDTNAMVIRRTRRARFRVVPRRRGDSTFEDWELAWRTSRRGNVVHVEAATARVLVHDGSQFSTPRPDQVAEAGYVAAVQ